MIRTSSAYLLGLVILLSQVGLPLNLHYCKGMLESVAVLFSAGCDNHEAVADLPKCCVPGDTNSCTDSDSECCDDELRVLTNDSVKVAPHFDSWDAVAGLPYSGTPFSIECIRQAISYTDVSFGSDSGPPMYILHQSLIYYA